MTTLRHLAAALLLAGSLTAVHAQSLRPEVGKPLQQASDLLRAGKAKEALAKVGEADRAANKTPAETVMIERMRGAAAQRAGDNATAAKAFEAAFATGKLSAAEQTQVAESLAFTYSQLKDNAKAGQWVQKAQALGSNSPQLKQLAAYLQASGGDYGAIAKNAAAAVAAAEQAGKRPEEADLLRLADAYQHTNNAAGQHAALEKLVANYPKKEYWSALLGRIQRKPGFSDRFAVDVLRLKLATGNLSSADDYMELAQLALQAGYAPEGKAVVDKGMAAGVLGVGAEAARHKRLLDLAVKQEQEGKAHLAQEVEQARDGNAMVQVGTQLVAYGQVDQGIDLLEKGIAKDQLRKPADAKLRLGLAQLKKNKAKGLQTLRSVQGNDGVADIARLYAILASQS
ncbi:hypothetical protein [Ideonella oryzae]|uniref:Tetratricopeptide repeat protein n=1 Tax=Ideonella oryzae TaxID=2937441 RepID=A0ABT1BIL8_9BURK|nr:hypothetical protein [Ideonella oryzae]MCO5975958.1 hypothetical protein [Ideonella oryzae]